MKSNARRNGGTNRQSGFTLIEILIVLVIIAILAAILFPVFSSARERARQTSCLSNMQQIYQAVTLYKQDEKRYPASIAALLPKDALLDDPAPATTAVNGQNCDAGDGTCPNARGTGYLKSTGNLICPNEARDAKVGISSYGDVSTGITKPTPAVITADNMGRYVWNYWGYKTDGTVYLTSTDAATDITAASQNRLVNPTATTSTCATAPCYDAQANPIKDSMSNRFAPASTIITHCVYHRYQTSDGYAGDDIYNPANSVNDARDMVLTLDGVAKSVNVAHYNAAGAGWQK